MLCDPFFLPAILPPSQSPDSTGISIQVGANLIVTPKFKWLSWIDCRGCWSKCEAERSRRVYPRPATWWRRASLRWIRVGPGATSSAPKTWSWPSPSAVSCGARTSAPPRRNPANPKIVAPKSTVSGQCASKFRGGNTRIRLVFRCFPHRTSIYSRFVRFSCVFRVLLLTPFSLLLNKDFSPQSQVPCVFLWGVTHINGAVTRIRTWVAFVNS